MVTDYQRLVFSVCIKLTGDYFASEDLTQETFLSAFRHMQDFDGASPGAWLCRIASNKCIDYNRHSARRMVPTEEETLNETPDQRGQPELQYIEQEISEKLQNHCKSLKPPYDEVAELYFCREMRPEEIAERQGKNVKTIQTQIYRARAMLRKIYGKERN